MFGDYKQQSSDRKFVGFKRKVQHSILIDVLWKENGVLHVRVEKSALFTEKVDDFDRIAALPEEMAQITVRANFFADGLAEFHQCSGIINNKVQIASSSVSNAKFSTPYLLTFSGKKTVSFMCAWKRAPCLPRKWMTSTGSQPCQKRWLKSQFAPISSPTASRSFINVRGL